MSGNGEPTTGTEDGQGQNGNGNGTPQGGNEQTANGQGAGGNQQQQDNGNQGDQGANDLPGDSSWPIEARQAMQRANREAANYRTQLRTAEGKLSEADKAKMSDIERANAERDEERTKNATLQEQVNGYKAKEGIAALADKFINPSIVAGLIPVGSIEWDADGKPTNLQSLVDGVAKQYPELLKAPGAFDGGAGQGANGNGGTRSMNDIIRSKAGR